MLPHAYRMLLFWLFYDASKREVSTQPKPTGCWSMVGMDCSACLSCGMVVLLLMTSCMLFHMCMVFGKKDDLDT